MKINLIREIWTNLTKHDNCVKTWLLEISRTMIKWNCQPHSGGLFILFLVSFLENSEGDPLPSLPMEDANTFNRVQKGGPNPISHQIVFLQIPAQIPQSQPVLLKLKSHSHFSIAFVS